MMMLRLVSKMRMEEASGKNKLKDIWSLPRGLKIVVACNDLDQPIGEEASVLGKFLGMVARNGCLCSLSYKDWRLLIGKRERNSNEQKNKMDILKQVKVHPLNLSYFCATLFWVLHTDEIPLPISHGKMDTVIYWRKKEAAQVKSEVPPF